MDTMSEQKRNVRLGRTPLIQDPEKRKLILSGIVPYIEHGMSIVKACEASGVPVATYYRWKALGREVALRLEERELIEPDESFSAADVAMFEFLKSVSMAELQCMDRNLLSIQVASQNHWQAAAWWLERRFPKEYGRSYKVEHSGNEEQPIAIKDVTGKPTMEDVLRKLSPEELKKVIEGLECIALVRLFF